MSCLAAEAELFHLSFGDLDASLIVCSIQDGLHFQTGLGLGCTEHRRNKRGVTGMRSFFRGAEALSTGVGREEMASQCGYYVNRAAGWVGGSFIVEEKDATTAVRRLHADFFGDVDPEVFEPAG